MRTQEDYLRSLREALSRSLPRDRQFRPYETVEFPNDRWEQELLGVAKALGVNIELVPGPEPSIYRLVYCHRVAVRDDLGALRVTQPSSLQLDPLALWLFERSPAEVRAGDVVHVNAESIGPGKTVVVEYPFIRADETDDNYWNELAAKVEMVPGRRYAVVGDDREKWIFQSLREDALTINAADQVQPVSKYDF